MSLKKTSISFTTELGWTVPFFFFRVILSLAFLVIGTEIFKSTPDDCLKSLGIVWVLWIIWDLVSNFSFIIETE